MITIYIHGFGGSGDGVKAKLFREYYKKINKPFIAPSLSYVPDLAINTLEELIESYDRNVKLIGSSMGGYFSIYLAQKYNLQATLINPAIYPYKTLRRTLGYALNYYDESKFEWNEKHLDMLKKYDSLNVYENRFMLLLQKGDDVLDYKEAAHKFANSKLIIENGGSHSFDGIERHFEDIIEFFSS
jgi:predicted esterase YcpF (UPF0227 family)